MRLEAIPQIACLACIASALLCWPQPRLNTASPSHPPFWPLLWPLPCRRPHPAALCRVLPGRHPLHPLGLCSGVGCGGNAGGRRSGGGGSSSKVASWSELGALGLCAGVSRGGNAGGRCRGGSSTIASHWPPLDGQLRRPCGWRRSSGGCAVVGWLAGGNPVNGSQPLWRQLVAACRQLTAEQVLQVACNSFHSFPIFFGGTAVLLDALHLLLITSLLNLLPTGFGLFRSRFCTQLLHTTVGTCPLATTTPFQTSEGARKQWAPMQEHAPSFWGVWQEKGAAKQSCQGGAHSDSRFVRRPPAALHGCL